MKTIQEIFNRIQEIKRDQKVIRESYKDALNSTGEHQKLTDQIKTLRERKKQTEFAAQREMSGDFAKLEALKVEAAAQNEMLSSVALTRYIKGETIGLTDSYDNAYEPVFVVRFKKTRVA